MSCVCKTGEVLLEIALIVVIANVEKHDHLVLKMIYKLFI